MITLLHGFMGDPSDWDLIKSELDDFELVVPRIRPAENWTTGIRQLGDELPERSLLVGYSMGARLCLAMALQRPERCAGLVLVSGNPGIEHEHARAARRQSDFDLARRIETEPRSEFLRYWYEQSTVFQSLSNELREAEIERKNSQASEDWGDLLRTYSVGEQPNFWPRLRELRMPVLAVAGWLDRKYSNIVIRMNVHRNIQSRIVPSCGHIVHHEQPYVFLCLLRPFLERHAAIHNPKQGVGS